MAKNLGPIADPTRYWFVSFTHKGGSGSSFTKNHEGKHFCIKREIVELQQISGLKDIVILNFIELSKEDYESASAEN